MNKDKRGGVDPAIVDGLRRRGLSEVHARGVAAGIEAESRSDHTVRGGYKDRAVGLGQWLGPRRADLFAKYGENPTKEQQLDYLAWELKGGDVGGKHVLAAKDEGAVLDAYITKFMRPAQGVETTSDLDRGRKALGLPATPRTGGQGKYSVSVGNTTVTTKDMREVSFEEAWNSTPDELFTGSRRPLGREPSAAKAPAKQDLVTAALIGPGGMGGATPDDAGAGAGLAQEAAWKTEQTDKEGFGHWDRFKAGMQETLTGSIIRHIGEKDPEFDSAWAASNRGKWADIEKFGETQDEVDQIREAGSAEHLSLIQQTIREDRQREKIINSSDSATAIRLGTGLLDPVGWAAGFGVGKAAQMVGVGSRALFAATRPVASLAAAAGEGAVGNLVVTAGLDAAGEYIPPEEYGLSALTGLMIGGALGFASNLHGGDAQAFQVAAERATARKQHVTAMGDAVRQDLGPDATDEAVAMAVREQRLGEYNATIQYALADIPVEQRLMVPEAPAEPSPVSTPVPVTDTRRLPDKGVVPAFLGQDGNVYPGQVGSNHMSAITPELRAVGQKKTGFATPEGFFLDRVEALAYVNSNGEVIRPSPSMKGELDALDYANQSAFIPPDISSTRREAWETSNSWWTGPRVYTRKTPNAPSAEALDVISRYDLASVSDDGERALIAKQIIQAEVLDKTITVKGGALKTILSKVGQQSTAGIMLQSKSPVLRTTTAALLENAQGAAGRNRTAAISMALREDSYAKTFSPYDDLYAVFRKQEGANGFNSRIADAMDGRTRNDFNNRVYREVERRQVQGPGIVSESSAVVREAADVVEAGMEMMRMDQQKANVIGAEALGNNSVGYLPRRLNQTALQSLTPAQHKLVRGELSAQFEHNLGMDKEWSGKLASQIVERGMRAANGSYQVPFNLNTPEFSQVVQEALEGMGLPREQFTELMGKFARGGASHTKTRLRINLDADIGDGMKLMDVFVTDVPGLYQSYARRVSGEVALAQFGVMGKQGLKVIRTAAEVTGATPSELKAFDQVAAEFLNTPFGEHQHAWMDNIRIGTSAARLGGMGITQFAESGNAIGPLGMQATLRSVGSLPRLMAEVQAMSKGTGAPNPLLSSFDTMSGDIGMDAYYQSRLFDVRDSQVELYNGETLGLGSRALRGAAHGNMVMSGQRVMMASQIRSMAEEILKRTMVFAKNGMGDKALDDMGINPRLRGLIKKDLDNIATFDGQGKLLSLDVTKSKALSHGDVNELTQAIHRGSSQIIQRTYTGETGAWAHNGLLKLLLQFRTFGITSVEKQWGRNMATYGGAKPYFILMGAMSFALPIHLARLQFKMILMDDAKRAKYWEENANPLALARATINYASASGLLGDTTDVAAIMAYNYGGEPGKHFGGTLNPRGSSGDKLVGGIIAPGVGLVNELAQGILSGNPKKIIKSLPGSNNPIIAPGVNALADAAKTGADSLKN